MLEAGSKQEESPRLVDDQGSPGMAMKGDEVGAGKQHRCMEHGFQKHQYYSILIFKLLNLLLLIVNKCFMFYNE